jgi:3-hydroxy acid dehydrogenase/malonic semialdehyde reductase
MTDSSGHTVLVTGATSGFGRAIALRFATEGAKVVVAGRRAERLANLAAEHPGRIHPLPLDVRNARAVFKAIEGLPAEFAALTVLVNNAGLALGLEPAHKAKWEEWDDMIATNVRGVAAVSRAVLPGMVERNRGHVINIGSIAGSYPYPGGNVYGGTKAFVRQFSLALRADLLGKNVRVTSIEPGMAETEFALVRFQNEAKAKAVYEGVAPLTAEDVAGVVFYAATVPAHVNINRIELMPTQQAFGPFAVHRE